MSEPQTNRYPNAIVLNRDLLFGSRIRSALAQLGLTPLFVRDVGQMIAAVSEHAETCGIVIVDMNGPVAWETFREGLADWSGLPTLAFGPHVDVEGRRAAKRAGVTRIVSNGQFHGEMVELIERYRRT